MAGIKLKSMIKASSILEVIIAMVVILIVFGIAMMIYGNVLRLSLSAQKLKAQGILAEFMNQPEAKSEDSAEILSAGDIRVERKSKPYGNSANLIEIDLTAYDLNQRKLAELQKIVLLEE